MLVEVSECCWICICYLCLGRTFSIVCSINVLAQDMVHRWCYFCEISCSGCSSCLMRKRLRAKAPIGEASYAPMLNRFNEESEVKLEDRLMSNGKGTMRCLMSVQLLRVVFSMWCDAWRVAKPSFHQTTDYLTTRVCHGIANCVLKLILMFQVAMVGVKSHGSKAKPTPIEFCICLCDSLRKRLHVKRQGYDANTGAGNVHLGSLMSCPSHVQVQS